MARFVAPNNNKNVMHAHFIRGQSLEPVGPQNCLAAIKGRAEKKPSKQVVTYRYSTYGKDWAKNIREKRKSEHTRKKKE